MPSYDAAFWRRVVAHATASVLMGTLLRFVENQAQKVTLSLTDDFVEHDLLEEMLEASKPPPADARALNRFDYLLRTPWRYPPLAWGSRFGRHFEPSLFYGALSQNALFAEAAYYRLLFLEGMERPFGDRVVSQFTVFEARYRSDRGLDLSRAPFHRHEPVLRHRSQYRPCQELGSVLREKGVEVITYLSARAGGRELNVALFTPSALRSRKHRNPRHGLCELLPERVTFRLGTDLYDYPREAFLDAGVFPQPA